MPKISVSEDSELAAEYPKKRMAKIQVTLKDGRALDHFQRTRKGDPENPLSDDELIAKYYELGRSVLKDSALDRLREQILNGHELPGAVKLR